MNFLLLLYSSRIGVRRFIEADVIVLQEALELHFDRIVVASLEVSGLT